MRTSTWSCWWWRRWASDEAVRRAAASSRRARAAAGRRAVAAAAARRWRARVATRRRHGRVHVGLQRTPPPRPRSTTATPKARARCRSDRRRARRALGASKEGPRGEDSRWRSDDACGRPRSRVESAHPQCCGAKVPRSDGLHNEDKPAASRREEVAKPRIGTRSPGRRTGAPPDASVARWSDNNAR